ncbi:S-layer homology domain-containing protein [Gudongella sp. DL1XJH-153]|uniref:S-layer homology domain-containing protein n=1 Tax=Gudongella sp. DL1XJH-153 TaxID=3409804 RepID=UPI003BB59249
MNKNKILSLILSIAIAVSMALGVYFPSEAYAKNESENIEKVIQETADYILKNQDGFSDAWSIIGLARYQKTDMENLSDTYLSSLRKELNQKQGILTTSKYTEYSKTILALTVLGIDPKDMEGYNLVEKLSDLDKLTIQGINGPIWALIALDSNDYSDLSTRESIIEYMLENEIEGGGWSLSSEIPDVDITAMVLTSLSRYKDRADVKPYIERGLEFISKAQNSDGGFETMSVENAESNAQVIVALTSLGIDPASDPGFIKNGNNVIDNSIENFYNISGGFSHLKDGKENKIATQQSFYALVSYQRFKQAKASLFDMTDSNIIIDNNSQASDEPRKNPFVDIENDPEKTAIIELSIEGIINGVTQTEFQPGKSISRAEFAALISRALDKEETHNHGFSDVKESDWFSGYVGAAKASGLIKGYPDNTFKPQDKITRQEASMVIYNIAKTMDLDTTISETETRNYLSQFPDYREIADWSKQAMAFGVKESYIPDNIIDIEPSRAATRSEVAGMLYRLLEDM